MDDLARSPVENPSVRTVWHDRLTVSVAMFSIIFEDKGEAAGTARGREGSLSGKTARRREDYSSSEYRPFVSSSGKPSLFCEGGKSVDATNACSNDIAGIFFFFFFFFLLFREASEPGPNVYPTARGESARRDEAEATDHRQKRCGFFFFSSFLPQSRVLTTRIVSTKGTLNLPELFITKHYSFLPPRRTVITLCYDVHEPVYTSCIGCSSYTSAVDQIPRKISM